MDFEVSIAIDAPPDTLRPDLAATAEIVPAARKGGLTIPIIALTVKTPKKSGGPEGSSEMKVEDAKAKARTEREKRRLEEEGVFVVAKDKAVFRPVKVGIAGDNYFEVVSGVSLDEEIVSGTYQAIRTLEDGDAIQMAKAEAAKKDDQEKGKDKDKGKEKDEDEAKSETKDGPPAEVKPGS